MAVEDAGESQARGKAPPASSGLDLAHWDTRALDVDQSHCEAEVFQFRLGAILQFSKLADAGANERRIEMCDYSLQHVSNRPARAGDKLVSTRFANSITRGFAATDEPNVAVCLLPGTELAFDRDVECSRSLTFIPRKKLREKTARFRQINLDKPYQHHDALEFPSGKVVLLDRLCEGQHATVLQLPPAGVERAEISEVRQPSVLGGKNDKLGTSHRNLSGAFQESVR